MIAGVRRSEAVKGATISTVTRNDYKDRTVQPTVSRPQPARARMGGGRMHSGCKPRGCMDTSSASLEEVVWPRSRKVRAAATID